MIFGLANTKAPSAETLALVARFYDRVGLPGFVVAHPWTDVAPPDGLPALNVYDHLLVKLNDVNSDIRKRSRGNDFVTPELIETLINLACSGGFDTRHARAASTALDACLGEKPQYSDKAFAMALAAPHADRGNQLDLINYFAERFPKSPQMTPILVQDVTRDAIGLGNVRWGRGLVTLHKLTDARNEFWEHAFNKALASIPESIAVGNTVTPYPLMADAVEARPSILTASHILTVLTYCPLVTADTESYYYNKVRFLYRASKLHPELVTPGVRRHVKEIAISQPWTACEQNFKMLAKDFYYDAPVTPLPAAAEATPTRGLFIQRVRALLTKKLG